MRLGFGQLVMVSSAFSVPTRKRVIYVSGGLWLLIVQTTDHRNFMVNYAEMKLN